MFDVPKEKNEAQRILEQQVKKERRRVKQFIRRAEKRGFTFSSTVVPDLPKKITEQTLSRWQKLTPSELYKKAVYTSPTGTTIKGLERRKQERKEASIKAAKTRKEYYRWSKEKPSSQPVNEGEVIIDVVLDDFGSYAQTRNDYSTYADIASNIMEWKPSSYWSEDLAKYKRRDKDRGWGILQGAINELGIEQVARNLKNNAIEVSNIIQRILYESGNSYRVDSRNGEINMALNRFQAIVYGRPLTVEESATFTDLAELNESNELL